ncbi:hypothetical protein LBMAG52_28670 [Planctomycetia bacterium]|nr:hypothetical protein LBMAG52_28670 [Planctomycetia bacterium]
MLVEEDSLVEGQAFAGFDFVGDLAESGVGSWCDHWRTSLGEPGGVSPGQKTVREKPGTDDVRFA